jgi:hypothetical protein
VGIIIIFVFYRIHPVATHNTEEFIYRHVDEQLEALGLLDVCAKDLISPIMEYVELGYGSSTEEELGKICHAVCAIVP